MNNWFLLHITRSPSEASILKGMLEDNAVPVFVMNKLDSSYLNFGDIEIYVPENLKELAIRLMDNGLVN